MLESRHSNIDFLGKDGFHWFLGQVAPDKSWRDKNNQNFDNGFRAKVRILGYHPAGADGISDDDLPWAHFLVSPQFGAGNNYQGTSFALQGGEMVFGFFLDGEEGQQPVVVGAFYANYNIADVEEYKKVVSQGTSNFKPFSYDEKLEKGDNIRLQKDEALLASGGVPDSNSTVRDESSTAKGTIIKHYDNETQEVEVAQKCDPPKAGVGDSTKELQGFMGKTSKLKKTKEGYVDPVTNKTVNMDKMVDKTSSKMAGGISGSVRGARKGLFTQINKGVDESVSFLEPDHLVKNLEIKKQKDSIYCLIENVINGLKNMIANFLKGMLGKLANFPLCAAEQFMGGLIASITDKIQNLIGGPLAAIGALAGIQLPAFSSMMADALDIGQTGLALFSCEGMECEPNPNDVITNVGPDPKALLDFNRVLGLAGGLGGLVGNIDGMINGMFPNILGGGGGLGPVGALAGPCNTQTKDCGPPRIEIFGGGGIGAVANAVINETGQVVGANMKNLGVGYTEAPYVTIIDDCDNGRGATGTPVVEDGQITNIIVTNTGGGYLGAGDSEGVDVIGEVENIQVVSTGAGYQEGDLIVSNSGQTLTPIIEDGRITGATGRIDLGLTKVPALFVESTTGGGAVIRPIIKFTKREDYTDPVVPEARVIRVVDCARIY